MAKNESPFLEGVIDPDHQKEVEMLLHNGSRVGYDWHPGDLAGCFYLFSLNFYDLWTNTWHSIKMACWLGAQIPKAWESVSEPPKSEEVLAGDEGNLEWMIEEEDIK